MRNARLSALALVLFLAWPFAATAEDFAAGSLIIPMDTDYQDDGMLQAYGLVYHLLLDDVAVHWCIEPGKNYGDADFTATAEDFATSTALTHSYRGGPFVIAAADAATASTRVSSWQATRTTTVHRATAPFSCDVARKLVNAPTIAMVADGNQKIARGYMQAAGIPDSTMDYTWPDSSPDMLDPVELAGPTTTNHADGKLFDGNGKPAYCQLMSMHWGINDANDNPEVVAEVRQYLNYPTHFFAQCQAVNAFENNVNGKFLTPNGFEIGDKPDVVDFFHADVPFAQLDGNWESVGGSEPAYSLPVGDTYKASDITMITEAGTPEGVNDVWMTGYLDGVCPPDLEVCTAQNFGKVSYLGGHEYDTRLPISSNPKTQGTRMFLNSLFEAPCVTELGQPQIELFKVGDAFSTDGTVTFEIEYQNTGVSAANQVVIRDPLPAGATFVSASTGGQLVAGEVVWNVGTVTSGEIGLVTMTVSFAAEGTYDNTAYAAYFAGLNRRDATSNTFDTVFCVPDDDASLCAANGAECGSLDISDNCGQARTVDCETGACSASAVCGTNNTCVCSSGYAGDGVTCTDVDECTDGTDTCAAEATCSNTDGGFDCACNSGFAGDGFTCTDIDECTDGTATCGANASCNNLPGDFECVCNPGWMGDGVTCTDLDECADGTDGCDTNATCTNSPGSFSCTCDTGWIGDGVTCDDVDECADGTLTCSGDGVCVNLPGSAECRCDDGFAGDGITCTDVDECADGTDDCDPNATCTNSVGSFSCACNAGWIGDGTACTDVDECADGSDDCDANAMCSNVPGSFECACLPGYQGDGRTCQQVSCACDDDEVCVGEVCFPACQGSDECPAGEACFGGRCATDACISVACGDEETCFGGGCFDTCTTNSDCGEGECFDGRCATTPCSGIVCAEGETCAGGSCFEACMTNADCSQGECFDGRCAATACAGIACADDEICRGGSCFLGCSENSDCPAGEQCYDSGCAPGSCAGITCPGDQICSGGGCFDPCDEDVDCSDTTDRCYEERCASSACEFVVCDADQVCIDGGCFVPCNSDDDCSGSACVTGRCTDDPCAGIVCADGEACADGTCTGECESDEQCPAGLRCQDGLCGEGGEGDDSSGKGGGSSAAGTSEGCGCASADAGARQAWLILVVLGLARVGRRRMRAPR